MVYLHTHRIVVADTHPQSRILLTYELLNMSQAVVTSIGAVGFQSELSYGNSHVVTDDQQPTLLDILLVERTALPLRFINVVGFSRNTLRPLSDVSATKP